MLSASRDLQQSGIEGDDGQVHSHDGVLLTVTNTADSLFSSAEELVAAPFTTSRDIHSMDSPKNHPSLSTEVCLFV